MKKIISIFLFFSCIHSYGQDLDLQGTYSAWIEEPLASESIKFVEKDSFYFLRDYCRNVSYGKGKCEILNNYLYLRFEKAENKMDSLKKKAGYFKINNGEVIIYEIDEASEDFIKMREENTGGNFIKFERDD